MEKLKNKLEQSANELEHLSDRTNLALTEMRLQFETMVEIQKEERVSLQKAHDEENNRLRKHYGKIIFSLILTLFLIISGLVGAMVYVFSTYEFECYSVQDLYIGGDGANSINSGIFNNTEK